MIIKGLEKIPGGRLLIFAMPLFLIAAGMTLLTADEMTLVDNSNSLVIALALAVVFKQAPSIFWREKENAGYIWMSLGIYTLVVTTVVLSAYSTYIRVRHLPIGYPNNWFVSIARFSYDFGFGCLFLSRFAMGNYVPLKAWLWLFGLVAFASLATVVGIRYF